MQFSAMPIELLTGLAVLTACVLAALQFLRVRPRQVRVLTTLFWQQAADQDRARTLLERFRHPRTYLLLLAASLLMLLALARPVFHNADQPHRVIVLEAGLAMTASDQRFDHALELVRSEAGSLANDRVAVFIADPQPRLLKHFDESLALLEERLAKVKAADTPVVREDILQVANSLFADRENGEVVLVSAQPATTNDADVRVLAAGEIIDNAFILSAVFVPDSADLTRGTFHFRVGFTGKLAGEVAIKVARADATLLEQSVAFKPGEVKEFSVADIGADGRLLTSSLADDAIAGDNRVDFQLPDRRQILVIPETGMELPKALAAVLGSLSEVTTEAVAGGNLPVVRVGSADSDAQIRIHPTNEDGELMLVRTSAHPQFDGLVFEDAVCRAPATPLNVENGNVPLLVAGGSPVATLNVEAGQLTVSGTIFDEDASLVRRTGYIVFWSKLLHRLAGWRNEPMTVSPVQSSQSTDATSANLAMNASMVNFDLASVSQTTTPSDGVGAGLAIWQLLLTAGLALMIFEAVLNIRGRIS